MSSNGTSTSHGRPRGIRAGEGDLRLAQVLGGLSSALDLADGHAEGHAARTALIGMRLGEFIGLTLAEREVLLHVLLAKDLGAPANAARFAALFGAGDHDVKAALRTVDWGKALEAVRFTAAEMSRGAGWPERVWRSIAAVSKGPSGVKDVARARAEHGAESARQLGLSGDAVQAIRSVDEHWNGTGFPLGLSAHAIHPYARITTLAQTMEVFWQRGGPRAALEIASARRGHWFEPALVDALICLKHDAAFWEGLAAPDVLDRALALEPASRAVGLDDAGLTNVALVYSRVVDAKSPWTLSHSEGVADLAIRLGARLGLSAAEQLDLHRAALLHDLGKLGVSNLILDKPGPLSSAERDDMRLHPARSAAVLARTAGFDRLAPLVGAHHERLDGSGYPRGLTAAELSMPARILAVADIADALRTSRPYRPGLSTDHLMAVMRREAGTAIDASCVEALGDVLKQLARLAAAGAPVVHVVPDLSEDYTQAA